MHANIILLPGGFNLCGIYDAVRVKSFLIMAPDFIFHQFVVVCVCVKCLLCSGYVDSYIMERTTAEC